MEKKSNKIVMEWTEGSNPHGHAVIGTKKSKQIIVDLLLLVVL